MNCSGTILYLYCITLLQLHVGCVALRCVACSPILIVCSIFLVFLVRTRTYLKNTPRYATLPNIMKAKKKKIDTFKAEDFDVNLEVRN